MFWKIRCVEDVDVVDVKPSGRFVLHRHVDREGEHLDLRLETDGHLRGWRIDAVSLEGEAWATEKAPHSLRWLEDDGAAERVDAGEYAWERVAGDGGVLILKSGDGVRRLEVGKAEVLSTRDAQTISGVLSRNSLDGIHAAGLIEDGLAARRNAIERLCGLGQELDSDTFNDAVWRKTLEGLQLSDIHEQLRSFEVRFDRKYPPMPVSQPERLDGEGTQSRSEQALAILKS